MGRFNLSLKKLKYTEYNKGNNAVIAKKIIVGIIKSHEATLSLAIFFPVLVLFFDINIPF